jgi:NAD(P)-dependent dehydrogenase (short-subunit alcohol dehydrogenase family)
MEQEINPLSGTTVLITGSARRLGKVMALAAASAGADIILHHAHSPAEAEETANEIHSLGRKAWILEADLNDNEQVKNLIASAFAMAPLDALINNAAIFKPVGLQETSLQDWNEHIQINLTAPFLLSQAFAAHLDSSKQGRIINLLDWRALRPGMDHFPYTISKAGLVALTQSLARSLAPRITVNGVALGAILPPGKEEFSSALIKNVPMKRWASLQELGSLITYLLNAPTFITGEIIHLDGGRHLV